MKNSNGTALEDEVVAILRREGLIRPDTPWYLRGPAAAGGFVLLLGIFLWAALAERTPLYDHEQYMLALYASPSYRHPPTGSEGLRAEEYGRWAAANRKGAAAIVGGEELGGTVATLGRPVSSDIAGFFLVSAASPEDAVALARSSPHLRYGGTIVVREIHE